MRVYFATIDITNAEGTCYVHVGGNNPLAHAVAAVASGYLADTSNRYVSVRYSTEEFAEEGERLDGCDDDEVPFG